MTVLFSFVGLSLLFVDSSLSSMVSILFSKFSEVEYFDVFRSMDNFSVIVKTQIYLISMIENMMSYFYIPEL